MRRKSANLKFQRGRWWVDYREVVGRELDEQSGRMRNKYRRVRESFEDKLDAEDTLRKVAERRIEDRRRRKLGAAMPTVEKGVAGFEQYARRVIAERFSENGRVKTRSSHQTCLNALLASPHFAGRRLMDISTQDVRGYVKERRLKHAVSANRELSFVKLVFNRAVADGDASVNPAAGVAKTEEPETKIVVLGDDKVKALIAASPDRLKPFLECLHITGMRKSEALSARWEYPGWDGDSRLKNTIVSLHRRIIHIPAGVAKSHKSREIPLDGRLLELFQGMKRKEGASVFGLGSIRRSFAAAAKKAKIVGLRIHHLRHTAASRMIENGTDVVTVCRLLGHSSLEITLRYCHSSSDKMKAAVRRMGNIHKLSQQAEVRLPKRVPSGQNVDTMPDDAHASNYKHYN